MRCQEEKTLSAISLGANFSLRTRKTGQSTGVLICRVDADVGELFKKPCDDRPIFVGADRVDPHKGMERSASTGENRKNWKRQSNE